MIGRLVAWLRVHNALIVLVPAGVLLLVGVALGLLGHDGAKDGCWLAAGAIGAVASGVAVVRGLVRRTAGVDVLALLAIGGALATGELLAAALISVMIGTGNLLDQWAQGAAERELAALLSRAPRRALLVRGDTIEDVSADAVVPGDVVQVPSGAVVPVDGRLSEPATLDESALTGESHLVHRDIGESVRSGVINAGNSARLVATSTAENSAYADIVRMVEQAQASSAPHVRMADRLSWWFIPAALAVAGIAWLVSGDPSRAVAVLVVATPCPLLLAVPVAIISGVSRAAARGVVVKGGQQLESLAEGTTLLFDKTGTLTAGTPQVLEVRSVGGVDPDEVLAKAASAEQVSPHAFATAVVGAARQRQLSLVAPEHVHEAHGHGLRAEVAGVEVALGAQDWVVGPRTPDWVAQVLDECELEGWSSVFVSLDGEVAGVLILADAMRPDAPRMLRSLRASGVHRIVLVTGDRPDLAETIGALAGVDEVRARQTPQDKVRAVEQERRGGTVIMVGDGINDAPALATADVGVALAGGGSSAASEAAGVILTVSRIDRLAEAMNIARRARRIALQSAVLGMGLSLIAMAAAAFGFLPAAVGALLQEAIDVLAIGNALRVRLRPPAHRLQLSAEQIDTVSEIRRDHEAHRAIAAQVRGAADEIAAGQRSGSTAQPLAPLLALLPVLETELLAHERLEESELVPVLRPVFGGQDPLASLSRTHAEIERQVVRLARLAEQNAERPSEHAVSEAVRMLYQLYGVLQLHNAQEDEELFSLIEDVGPVK